MYDISLPISQSISTEKETLISEWKPEPLVPDTPQDHPALNPRYITGKIGKYVKIGDEEYLNLATSNFLGLIGDERIEAIAPIEMHKSTDFRRDPRRQFTSMELVLAVLVDSTALSMCTWIWRSSWQSLRALKRPCCTATGSQPWPVPFLPTPKEATWYLQYSQLWNATLRRFFSIFVDKAVNFAVQKGLQACRSRLEWFDHNNVDHLTSLLEIQRQFDEQNPEKAKTTRRFLVVEGLYMNTGQVCPLPQLVSLKWKYKLRILVDESLSLMVLGPTGRGVTEHWGVSVDDVDMIMGSLEHSLGSTGGFCCGRSFVVAHQRLAGLGYCFSASLPPLLAVAACTCHSAARSGCHRSIAAEAMRIISVERQRLEKLHRNAEQCACHLRKVLAHSRFSVQGCQYSPILHIQVGDESHSPMAADLLDRLVEQLWARNIAVTRARYLVDEETFPIPPRWVVFGDPNRIAGLLSSIRLIVNSDLTLEEIHRTVDIIGEIASDLSSVPGVQK